MRSKTNRIGRLGMRFASQRYYVVVILSTSLFCLIWMSGCAAMLFPGLLLVDSPTKAPQNEEFSVASVDQDAADARDIVPVSASYSSGRTESGSDMSISDDAIILTSYEEAE